MDESNQGEKNTGDSPAGGREEVLHPASQDNNGHEEKTDAKKIKNLISIIILLAGLFAGSLFVDISQLVKGSGYSKKNLSRSDIFEAGGKTWVAFEEPAVPVSIITDDDCEKCDVSEAVIWLRRVLPTISTEKIAFDSDSGKELIEKYQVRTLPAFIFGEPVQSSELFAQAQELFDKKETSYVLNTQALGLPAGKYLSLPEVEEGDAVYGVADSKVKVIIYSDFQCPYCKVFYETLRATMKDYEDRVSFAFKELPLDIHEQANTAALASQCALEQEKFWEYADILYAKQTEWGSAKDNQVYKKYASQLKLDGGQFGKCLDEKKYQDKIDADKQEANSYGITGTPTIFVNDRVESGAVTAEKLKESIDEQLEI